MRGAATNQPKFDQYAALAKGKQGSAFYSRNQGTRYTVLAVIVAFAAVLAGLHFSPETEVRDKSGHRYKYANKPRGMQHWLAAVSSQGR